jgi:light-regulated signal transduction histidine kinase (bacteriophytochrome)
MIEGVQIVDKEWKYIYANDTVVVHSKFNKKELLGSTMMKMYPGIEHTEMFAFMEVCMKEGKAHQMINEFDFPDGSKGYFEIRMQPVEEGVLVVSFDATKQKQAELVLQNTNMMLDEMVRRRTIELMSKNRELEQFNYITSHDLQEPLRTLSNYIQVLKEDYSEVLDKEGLGYLNSMDKAVNRMSLLTKALLDYSHLGRDRKLTFVDCSKLVNDVLDDLKAVIQSSRATIEVGEMPKLNAYEVELRQLFQNLIANAIKFSQKGIIPEISISSKYMGECWEFSISDNGIGIDPAYYERIFHIFQRLHKPEDFEGSGIGLANCKKIVELHGGEIAVESNLGKGSRFTSTISILK